MAPSGGRRVRDRLLYVWIAYLEVAVFYKPRLITLMAAGVMLSSFASASGASASAAASLVGSQITLSDFSNPGDALGNGTSQIITTGWASYSYATTAGVRLTSNATSTPSSFAFSPPTGQTLTVGSYANATNVATQNNPGIDMSINSIGCSTNTGSFQIWDLATDGSGNITRLDLTWVEHCNGGQPANFGELLINEPAQLGSLMASSSHIVWPNEPITVPYVLTNPTAQAQPVTTAVSPASAPFTVTPVTLACASSVPADSSCAYNIAFTPTIMGTYSASVNETSGSSTAQLYLAGTYSVVNAEALLSQALGTAAKQTNYTISGVIATVHITVAQTARGFSTVTSVPRVGVLSMVGLSGYNYLFVKGSTITILHKVLKIKHPTKREINVWYKLRLSDSRFFSVAIAGSFGVSQSIAQQFSISPVGWSNVASYLGQAAINGVGVYALSAASTFFSTSSGFAPTTAYVTTGPNPTLYAMTATPTADIFYFSKWGTTQVLAPRTKSNLPR